VVETTGFEPAPTDW